MKYAAIKKNDVVDCESGICVSFWTQGCPHRCPGCHNAQTWDFNGGLEAKEEDIINTMIKAIGANGINRNFSILGGEPLCEENRKFVELLIMCVKKYYPNIKIYLWTGYTIEELYQTEDLTIKNILHNIDILIEGRFILEKRDITLPLRGSTNQRVLHRGIDF